MNIIMKPGTPLRIKLNRGEGPSAECGHPVTITPSGGRDIWKDAETILNRWRRTAPEGGCYDKTDFWLDLGQGDGLDDYQGRYDLAKDNALGHGDSPTLRDHVLEHVAYIAGLFKPAHVDSWDTYMLNVSQYNKQLAIDCRDMLKRFFPADLARLERVKRDALQAPPKAGMAGPLTRALAQTAVKMQAARPAKGDLDITFE